MDNASKFAKNRLQEATQAKHSATLMATVLGTLALALVVVLCVAFLDYWLMLVPAVRYGGLALLCLFLGLGIYKWVKILKRPARLKEAALDAEALKPEIGCELSTAAEYLSGERDASREYEKELANALQDKAAGHLQKVQLPYWQRLIRPVVIVSLLLLTALFFGVLASGGFTAFQRAIFPWSAANYTSVKVIPGNVEIPIGRDLEIKSIFSGRIPREAKFQWQDANGADGANHVDWQFAKLTQNDKGEYIHPLKNLKTPLKYRVTGSDAISPEFLIEPYTPAEVKAWKVDLELPSYTRRPALTQDTPEISVLRGSTARIQIAPNVKLSSAQIRFKDAEPLALTRRENGFWTAELKVKQDSEFTVHLVDEKGRPGNSDSVYKITALPDEIPVVEIAEPGEDIRAAATNTVPVKIKAMDDYGLHELKLVYHRLSGPEEIITATRSGETNTEFTAEIPLSPLALKEYELVAYHALAVDNNTLDGPGIGKSDVFFVEITNEEGGECKCQGKGERVNLLVIQKQIVADTVALGPEPSTEKLEELGKRQADAAEFARMYQQSIAQGGGSEALNEMSNALREMESAQRALEQKQAKIALPPVERALASLYQVIKLMPELENLPTVPPEKKDEEAEPKPPQLQVVLNAIKKKKEEQPNTEQLAQALEEAKRLQDEQASVNIGVQNKSSGSPSGSPSETQLDRSGKGEQSGKKEDQTAESKLAQNSAKGAKSAKSQNKKGQAKTGQKQNGEKGEGEAQSENPGEGQGQAMAEGKGKIPGKGAKPGEPSESTTEPKLAVKESELSKEAAELAEKLERLAGKDKRLGHGAKRMSEAAEKMEAAADAIGKGDTAKAGTNGAEAGAALEATIASLERILQGRPERVDVSKEDAPKQFETAIADYFKALSYEN